MYQLEWKLCHKLHILYMVLLPCVNQLVLFYPMWTILCFHWLFVRITPNRHFNIHNNIKRTFTHCVGSSTYKNKKCELGCNYTCLHVFLPRQLRTSAGSEQVNITKLIHVTSWMNHLITIHSLILFFPKRFWEKKRLSTNYSEVSHDTRPHTCCQDMWCHCGEGLTLSCVESPFCLVCINLCLFKLLARVNAFLQTPQTWSFFLHGLTCVLSIDEPE
jgi:hypothetical protein